MFNMRELPRYVFVLPSLLFLSNTVCSCPRTAPASTSQTSVFAMHICWLAPSHSPDEQALQAEPLNSSSMSNASMQVMQWLGFALRGTDALQQPATERQADEVFALVASALVQSFIMVISWVYIVDSCEAVAKRLEEAAPGAVPQSPHTGGARIMVNVLTFALALRAANPTLCLVYSVLCW